MIGRMVWNTCREGNYSLFSSCIYSFAFLNFYLFRSWNEPNKAQAQRFSTPIIRYFFVQNIVTFLNLFY